MSLVDEAREIFAKIGSFADLAAVDEYEAGPSWHLAVDEATFVAADLAPERGTVVLSGALGRVADPARFAPLALTFNCAWTENGGSRLALDAEGRGWLLLDWAPGAGRERDLAPILKRFAQQATAWRAVAAGTPAPQRDEDTSFSFSDAIRV